MKKFKNIKTILVSTKYIRWIIFIQVFIFLFMTIGFVNRYIKEKEELNKFVDSPFKNSILYMGNIEYSVKRDNRNINNHNDIKKDKDLIYKYYQKNNFIFNGISIFNKTYYIDTGTDNLRLKTFDYNTLNVINPDILRKYNFNSKDVIEVIVKNKYPIGKLINIETKNNNVNLKVIGYFGKETINLELGIVSSMTFPIRDLVLSNNTQYNYFITDIHNPKLQLLEKYAQKEINDAVILYLKNDVKRKDLKDFENYVNVNQLGYYQYSDDLIKEQEKSNNYTIQSRLDVVISLLTVLVFSLLSIGYINRDILENRFRIYYLNGAKSKDIFYLSFIYYSIILFTPILFYNLLMYIINIEFIRSNIIIYFNILFRKTLDDNILHIREFLILSFILILLISIISYWQVRYIEKKNRYIGD
ncbi:hypothetical protein [Helcococcus kunzii]|uniref:hypothetical protein n=1 Tax=Helcococcus kunzii TaxID=40091 RepID=UPI0024AE0182|nr:hypothetical protein [Helcococcus kunzii]